MLLELDFIGGIRKLFSRGNIVSISGESGTGKTTLALFIVGNLLTHDDQFEGSCIWIQSSELFPVRRMTRMFEGEKLSHVKQSIYVRPGNGTIKSYLEQCNIMREIFNSASILPPDVKYIVIDNISHHLRHELFQYSDISQIIKLLNSFYDGCLMPLILFCKRNSISLILIHEVTYDPKTGTIRPFSYKLYDRLCSINIVLGNKFNNQEKKMEIGFDGFRWTFVYRIVDRGITIL